MAPPLQLLGAPAWHGPGAALPFRCEQRFRVLAYVAAQRRPVQRDRVAFVFWPDQPNDVARRNLRKTWFALRRLEDIGATLAADGSLLGCTAATDLAHWQALLEAGRLREAVESYGGRLLHGLDGGSGEFQRWLDLERERIARRQRDAVLALLAALAPTDRPAALGWLDRLLEQDPLDEATAQARVRLLRALGQPAAARRAHEQWRRLMKEELGVEAPPEAQEAPEVPQALEAPGASFAPAPVAAPRRHVGAPAYLSRFVGRRHELATLEAHLSSGARLVTVLGPPGSGKTRLAAVAFETLALPAFARRVFVELDRLPADGPPAELVQRIAAAIGLHVAEGERQADHLAQALAREPTWLVLDNLEHRLGDLPLLRRLLAEPTLAVLATSRTRLAIDGEVVLALGGLVLARGHAADEALQLFELRCSRSLDAEARQAAQRLCTLLEGQPLAIELAARQCELLAPAELAARLASSLQALADETPHRPLRQRSLAAAFDASWRLLPPPLQHALARLAVLRADFSPAAAQAVAGAGEAVLATLVDRSLLRPEPARGQLRWHPFVREFALARLDTEALAATQLAHASYHAGRVLAFDLREENPTLPALRKLASEMENIVDAWRHALAHGRHDLWEPLAEALALHFEVQARFREGGDLLAECAPAEGADAAVLRAGARVKVLRARLLHWAENAAAQALAGEALQVFERCNDDAGRIAAWRVQAVVAWRRGDAKRAVTTFRRALALGERSGHNGKRAMLLDGLGLALLYSGDADGSRAAFEEALALNERSGNALQRVHNLINLALDARVRTPPQAMALARRALELAEDIGFLHYVPHCLVTMAFAELAAGNAANAQRSAARAVELTRAAGDSYVESWAQTANAHIALARGDPAAAIAALRRGLELAWADQDLGLVAQHLTLAAEVLAGRGAFESAHSIVQSLLAQRLVPLWQRRRLQALQGTWPAPGDAPRRLSLAGLLHEVQGTLLGAWAPP